MQKQEKSLLTGNFSRFLIVAGVFAGFFGCDQQVQDNLPEEQSIEAPAEISWEETGEVQVRITGNESVADHSNELVLVSQSGDVIMRSRVYPTNDYTFNIVVPGSEPLVTVKCDEHESVVRVKNGVLSLDLEDISRNTLAMNP